ncbi:hypothetical protein FRB99_001536 [Tulasnella sp. 403]|nr:hypothetical protein FRB99_001536 [Tulasnella sp. 403]
MDFIKSAVHNVASKSRPPSYVSALFKDDHDDYDSKSHPLQPVGGPSSPARPRPKQWFPMYLRPWFITMVLILMLITAVIVEIAAYFSEKRGGWRLLGIAEFGGANFLKSAIPVILTTPAGFVFGKIDEALAGMHPYVVLAKGRAPAKKSILLSYSGGRPTVMFQSFLNTHFLVLFSSAICLATGVLSPLASGILTSRGSPVTIPNVQVTSVKSLGLVSDFDSLASFLGAAGFASAAATQNLTDPPSILGSWSVAQFNVPPATGPGENGTVVVPTTGIQTLSGCGSAVSTTTSQTASGFSLTGAWRTCNVAFQLPATGADQYGIEPVSLCQGDLANLPLQFQPVVFWFLSESTKTTGMTFCQPTSKAYNVLAHADLGSGLLTKIDIVDANVAPNNFTGAPQNGQTFNGATFDTTNAPPLVKARGLAIQTALPDAIYRATRSYPGGLPAMIAQNNGQPLTDLTNHTYTQFLSIAAQSTYFFDTIAPIQSQIINWEIRLWIYPIAAHAFAAALVVIAIIALVVHMQHAKARRDVFLSADPGTIGATLSMTSESQFYKTLRAGDDEDAMERKFKGMTFGISRRTWQIVAEGQEEGCIGKKKKKRPFGGEVVRVRRFKKDVALNGGIEE